MASIAQGHYVPSPDKKTDVVKAPEAEAAAPKQLMATTSQGFKQPHRQQPIQSQAKLARTTHSLANSRPKAPPDYFKKKELLRIRRENSRLANKLVDLRSTGSSLSKERLLRDQHKLANKTASSRILADPYSHDIVPSKFGLLKLPEGFKKRSLQGFQFKKVAVADADAQQRAARPTGADCRPAQAKTRSVPREEKKNLPNNQQP